MTTQRVGAWRVGEHYGIHVYEGDRPVATFHNPEDAQAAVDAHNARLLVIDIVSFAPGRWQVRCRLCDYESIWHAGNAEGSDDASMHMESAHPEVTR